MKRKYFLYTLFFILLIANFVLYFYSSGELRYFFCNSTPNQQPHPTAVIKVNTDNNSETSNSKFDSEFPPLWPGVEWSEPVVQNYSPLADPYQKPINSKKYVSAKTVKKEDTYIFSEYYEAILEKSGWNFSDRADAPTTHSSFVEYNKGEKYINFGYKPTKPGIDYTLMVIHAKFTD